MGMQRNDLVVRRRLVQIMVRSGWRRSRRYRAEIAAMYERGQGC
jgi:hypothetical protein